ncbi:structural maintenance of chromosomes protein 6-like isoform X2 [Mercenaria mercenaria]|uniref:structural maintenance of chromosomes protein 6-like isoform X2 n=1 Tax=Mercenaria mercenaria TaxID=6596 RepID=UPI00234E71CB|nr:structural maintenance of chromosomes protein 6-like isoform X2 [Mercenaria mercenaria]
MKRKNQQEGGSRSKRRATEESSDEEEEHLPVAKVARRDGHSSGPSRGGAGSSEEDDVMDMSQRPDFPVDSKEADVGIIEKVSLKNFMCHNRLDIPLGPNINFIVGNNGSGKSAVVTALVVGLGGKAAVTNRGSKLKSFVKTGKQVAEVEIKLRNRGPDAFRPDLYGDTISVRRKFNADGSTQYKLVSKSGKVISTKKDDLTRILDQFNIQVDNPVAVLNQDTSRNFLNSKSPQDKYKFFLKATQLEQIKEDYSTASDRKELTKEIIAVKMQTLPKLEKEVLDWEQKYKSLTAIKELENKTKRLKEEMAWALVIEKEKGMTPLEKEFKHEEARLPRFKSKADEAKGSLDTMNKQMQELTAKLNVSGEEVKQLQPAHQEARNALNEQKKITRNAHMEVKRLESALKNLKKEKQSIVERIAEIQTSSRHDYEKERKGRMKKIEVLEGKLASIQAQETTTDHQLDQFRNAIQKYKNDRFKLGQDQQVSQTQIDKHQKNLQSLRASQGNRLKRFGSFMPQLIQTVEEYARLGRFHKKPIGPLGACFTLADQKWALAVECCLKGLMNSFCCHDYHDEKVLEQIISNVSPNYKPTIIVSRFKDRVYDVSEKRADNSKFRSVLDMVKCDHPMVYNTLIDQRTVECVLLIEDGRLARQVMDPDKRPGPPRNSREAFTAQGDQVFSFPTFRYYSSNQDKAKFLTANVEEDIAALVSQVEALQQTLGQIRQQKVQLDSEIQINTREERKAETTLMKIREEKRKLSLEISELKNIEDPAPVDVATYEEEVKMLEEQLSSHQLQLESKTTIHKEQEQLQENLQEQYKQIDVQIRSKIDAGDAIKEEVGNVVNEIETCKTNKKHYDSKLKEQEKKIKELKDKLDKYKVEVESDVEKAQTIHSERINTRRSPSNLKSEILQIEKQIKNEERRRGDPEEITRQYKEKKDSYLKIKCEVKQLRKFIEELEKSLKKRQKAHRILLQSLSWRVKVYFNGVLNSNPAFEGKLEISNKHKFIHLNVQPSKTAGTEGAKDLRSLSGGERSFSTVCFILALWDAMESPFRCLDEFDVFMDMVNRRISMEMMMKTARTQTERQFIFLSPQSMSNLGIASTKMMKIFKMPNPERGQKTIEFPSTSDE